LAERHLVLAQHLAVALAGHDHAATTLNPKLAPTPGPTLPDKPSIAALAFTNLSSDPEQEYLADGIVEDIITELSRLSGLVIIARNSSF
jgi:TolB-like protein